MGIDTTQGSLGEGFTRFERTLILAGPILAAAFLVMDVCKSAELQVVEANQRVKVLESELSQREKAHTQEMRTLKDKLAALEQSRTDGHPAVGPEVSANMIDGVVIDEYFVRDATATIRGTAPSYDVVAFAQRLKAARCFLGLSIKPASQKSDLAVEWELTCRKRDPFNNEYSGALLPVAPAAAPDPAPLPKVMGDFPDRSRPPPAPYDLLQRPWD